eukprot:Pgem_evm1s16668
MNENDKLKFNNMILDMIVMNNLPLHLIESTSFTKFCDFLKPNCSEAVLPKKRFFGSLLEQRASI